MMISKQLKTKTTKSKSGYVLAVHPLKTICLTPLSNLLFVKLFLVSDANKLDHDMDFQLYDSLYRHDFSKLDEQNFFLWWQTVAHRSTPNIDFCTLKDSGLTR